MKGIQDGGDVRSNILTGLEILFEHQLERENITCLQRDKL